MPFNFSIRAVGALAIAAISILSVNAGAECVRWKPTPRPADAPPDTDGPGSWGELQDTGTLDCLTYVGSVEKDGKERVLIRDEGGVVHVLGVGHFMGQNTGVITMIDEKFIYLEQVVSRHPDWRETDHPPFVPYSDWTGDGDGQWEVVVVKFPKCPGER